MNGHMQPNERPIHPSCKKLMSRDFMCTCSIEWQGWDGSDDGLDRHIRRATKQDLRTGWGAPGSMGHAPDADEALNERPHHERDKGDDSFVVEHAGYWKESENLKTIRGDAHWEDNVNRTILMDRLRLHIIDRGYWGDCSGAELDDLRSRVTIDQALADERLTNLRNAVTV